KLLDVHGVEPSCLCCRFYGSIGAKPCQALFALGGMLACAGHIIGRDSLRPPCVRVRMRAGACAHADGRTCAGACVCACVWGVPGPRWNDASPGAGARGGGSTHTQLTPLHPPPYT